MDNAGIIAQYGFLYQRKAFILYALENANTKQTYTFEGKDDIETTLDEGIYCLYDQSATYIQVKSGFVDEDCFCKIIGNWLLLDRKTFDHVILFSENNLTFAIDDSMAQKIVKYVLNGKKKKKSAISRKVYEKFKESICNDSNAFLEKIIDIIRNLHHDICGMDELNVRLEKIFLKPIVKILRNIIWQKLSD